MDRQINATIAIGIVTLVSVVSLIFVLHFGEKQVTAAVMESSLPVE